MELTTVVQIRNLFYRLLSTDEDDSGLTQQGESINEVAYTYLTEGCRAAQRWMLKNGYHGWRRRSSAITSWSGADATDGGRYTDLPSDHLRVYGTGQMSALVLANGEPWGELIEPENYQYEGDFYYIRGEELWLTRKAQVPATVYLEHHYLHPAWSDGVTIDFPIEARRLIAAEAAWRAVDESWYPFGPVEELKIEKAVTKARSHAASIARPTKEPRRMRPARRYGTRGG